MTQHCMDSGQIFNIYFQVVFPGGNMHCLIFLGEKVLSVIQAWYDISTRESIIQAWYWQIPRSR